MIFRKNLIGQGGKYISYLAATLFFYQKVRVSRLFHFILLSNYSQIKFQVSDEFIPHLSSNKLAIFMNLSHHITFLHPITTPVCKIFNNKET